MKIILDKIGSVTKNANLPYEVEISNEMEAVEGAIIAVEVMEDKKIYNQLELVSGRLSTLQKGDVIAVALGQRRALKGFVGTIPKTLNPGDIINILNLGGVAGICTSENITEVGHALKVKTMGAICKEGKAMNIKHFAIFESQKKLVKASPLIVVSGTCMNVGKTTVASEIIKHLQGRGLTIFATKLAGVAALRDTENMKDYGAKRAVSFVDAGYPSTVDTQGKAVEVAKGAIQYLSQGNPNYIVIEFGDGLFGEYEVMEILKDKEIQNHIVAHIGCAHDPMGADKLAEVCQEIGIPLDVISGPVTDNSVGIHFVKDHIGVAAYNACNNGEALFHYLSATCLNK